MLHPGTVARRKTILNAGIRLSKKLVCSPAAGKFACRKGGAATQGKERECCKSGGSTGSINEHIYSMGENASPFHSLAGQTAEFRYEKREKRLTPSPHGNMIVLRDEPKCREGIGQGIGETIPAARWHHLLRSILEAP